MRLMLTPLLLICLTLAACGRSEPTSEPPVRPAPATLVTHHAEDETRPLVVYLGDSLTAGMSLPVDEAYPAVIERKLAEQGIHVRTINAGISGDSTAGGLRRLDWALRSNPDVLVVGLGANDGLRGTDPAATEENLRKIITRARSAGARVLLLGMLIPPNYGPEYSEAFAAIYPRLARELEVPLVPFLLEGVAGHPDLNLPDGIHPNREGQVLVAENVLPKLESILQALDDQRSAAANP